MSDPEAVDPIETPANRRNLYRVLHVQPEAPLEVIRASWRTLMARTHPDLGGRHAEAALINAAWEVLGDPVRRAAYDLELRRHIDAGRDAAAGMGAQTDFGAFAHGHQRGRDAGVACPLCAQPVPPEVLPHSRCVRCDAPLATLPLPGRLPNELLGRRGATRRDRGDSVLLRVGWPSPDLPACWRDLSLTGLSIWTPVPLQTGQRFHLIDPVLELVGEVVGCRPQGRLHSVHARLLTLMPKRPTGVFVAATA